MPTIQIARRLSMVLLGMFVAVPTGAQLSLVKGTLSGSGGPSSGGAFTAHTTTSQPDAGEASGGPYDVTGGFAEGDPADCAALAAAASVTASETFCAAVRVSWADLTQFEAGFRVFRDSVQIAIAPADVTIYDDSTAVAGFPYTYYVVTMNDCGDANPSNTDVGHRPQNPVPPEAVQLGGAVADMDSIHVSLTWTDLSMDETTQVVFQVDSTLTPVATIGPNVEAVTITVYNDGPVDRCYAVAAQNCGVSALSDSVCTGIIAVGGAPSVIPRAFALGTLSPNPFNPTLRVQFDVPHRSSTTLRVFDVSGRVVRTLRDEITAPGRYTLSWDGTDDRRRSVASGVYFVEMKAPEFRRVRQVTLLK